MKNRNYFIFILFFVTQHKIKHTHKTLTHLSYLLQMTLKEGDEVLLPQFGGQEFKVDDEV